MATMAHLAQIRRWAKAIHIEMLHARETPITWPRGAENARLDAIVACNQIASLAQDAEQTIEKGQSDVLALLVSRIQVQAQDVELMLSRVGA